MEKIHFLDNSNASSNHTISPIKQKGVGRGNVQEFGEMYYWKIFKTKNTRHFILKLFSVKISYANNN